MDFSFQIRVVDYVVVDENDRMVYGGSNTFLVSRITTDDCGTEQEENKKKEWEKIPKWENRQKKKKQMTSSDRAVEYLGEVGRKRVVSPSSAARPSSRPYSMREYGLVSGTVRTLVPTHTRTDYTIP